LQRPGQQQVFFLKLDGGLLHVNQSINQSCIFRVVQVIKSLHVAMAALQRQEGMSSAIGVRLLYCEMERPGNLPSNPSKQHYMMQAQRKPFRLGCRPAKQGPRPLSSNQGRVEKSVTDDEENKDRRILSQGHAKQLQLRNKFRLGTRNIRSMLQLSSTTR